ncbi:MAG: hypothetical protein HY912_24995 [Desulfomonile tiedjei]|uniref:Uncharacterized protein n=1 Tax=Desulfomonile tiedjei TaxID=2358 RepID=A0A9D6V706_9BACT|nr:hypothetical protein [Desulfomonile tiedjei]
MRIAFDIDGVVLRSIDVILDRINTVTGRNIKPDDLAGWELEPLGLDKDTLWDAVRYMYSQPKIEPYSDAVKVLNRIYREKKSPLLFITGRSDPKTALPQLQALPWNPTMPEMIVVGGNRDKRLYLSEQSVDFIIEDDIAYLQEYLNLGIGVGLMVQPWNRLTEVPVTKRFDDWTELGTWLLEKIAPQRQ